MEQSIRNGSAFSSHFLRNLVKEEQIEGHNDVTSDHEDEIKFHEDEKNIQEDEKKFEKFFSRTQKYFTCPASCEGE